MFTRREDRENRQKREGNWFGLLLSRRGLRVIVFGLCVLAVAGCTGNTQPGKATPATEQRATATPEKKMVLFETDWVKGLKEWQVAGGWKVKDGYIESDLGDALSLTLPYQPTVADYAVEFRLQVASVPRDGGGFQLVADRQSGKNGYSADILGLLTPGQHRFATHPLSEVLLNPEDAMQANPQVDDYEPSDQWRLYRVEVKGERVNFIIEGNRVSSAISSQTANLSNGPIHFLSHAAILRISSFRVLSN